MSGPLAFDVEVLTRAVRPVPLAFTIRVAESAADHAAAFALRHSVFVVEQGLFSRHDRDHRRR